MEGLGQDGIRGVGEAPLHASVVAEQRQQGQLAAGEAVGQLVDPSCRDQIEQGGAGHG